ncbi:hypothetical protein KI387_036274, partial [Taxus chinensis]
MDFTSLLTTVGTSFVVFVVLFLLFSCLSTRPGNFVIYYPAKILRAKGQGKGKDDFVPRSGSPFAWLVEAWRASEDDIIAAAGLDAAVYLIFIATALEILVLCAAVCLPLLIPLSATDHNNQIQLEREIAKNKTSVSKYDDFDNLAMGNIQQKSVRLWGFVVAAYFVSFVTYFILWKTYKHVLNLRAREQASLEAKPEQFTILVRDIPPVPPGKTRKEQVDSFFRRLHPDTFEQSLIITDISEANKVWEEIRGYRKKLSRAEFIFEESKTTKTPEGTRPLHKTGFLGLVGKHVDSIDFYNEKIKDLTVKLKTKQKIALTEKQAEAAFIIFKSRPAAAAASQVVHSQLTDIMDLEKKALKSILEAYLPQIALLLFLAFLPALLLMLSTAEGIPSQSHVVRSASGKYFYFIVFNVFLGVTIGGTLFDSIKKIQKDPSSVITILASSLPKTASFFISFVALKNFVGYGLELSRLVPLVIYHIKRRFLCKTEAEVQEAWAPGAFGYATRVPNDMLVITIALSYAVIAPMIIPFAILYFFVGWIVLRNQALNVYVPSYESNGRMWPHIHIRILAAIVLSQITMIGYFSAKEFVYSPLLIPLPFMSVAFGYVCKKRFYSSFCVTSLEVACNDVKEAPSLPTIVEAYTPPCLLPEDKFDDPE